jgi:tetratricopeptide (TPR) repeat protein
MAVRTLARLDGKYRQDQTGTDRLNALLARLMQDPRARPGWIVGALDDLGQIEYAAGRYRAAIEKFDATSAYCQKSSDPKGIQCIYTQYERALTLLLLGHAERAMETVPPLLDDSRISPNSASFATRFTRLAFQVLAANQQLARYPAVTAKMQALGDSMGDDEWLQKLQLLLAQGKVHLQQGRLNEAQAMSQRAQAMLSTRRLAARNAPEVFLLDGLVEQAMGQPARALVALDRALAGQVDVAGDDHPRTQLLSVHRARALWATHRGAEALALIDHALPILRAALGDDAPTLMKIRALRSELAGNQPSSPEATRKVELFL